LSRTCESGDRYIAASLTLTDIDMIVHPSAQLCHSPRDEQRRASQRQSVLKIDHA
jgi:hypothetical protein